MNFFIKKILIFSFILVFIIFIGLLILPYPKVQDSLLGGMTYKHELLTKAKSPKLVFVGGSNLSFSLNSQKIHEAFEIDVVNMGIHHFIGLKYMCNDILPYIKDEDIVVICPEYTQFFGEVADGRHELLSILFDTDKNTTNLQKLELTQVFKLTSLLPKYALIKWNNFLKSLITQSAPANETIINEYHRLSFNEFGDVQLHYDKSKMDFIPYPKTNDRFNAKIINWLIKYTAKLEQRNIKVFLMFPCIQESLYNEESDKIESVYQSLKETEMSLLGEPSLQIYSDSLFYDSSYHLRRNGVNQRTKQVIKLLQTADLLKISSNQGKQ